MTNEIAVIQPILNELSEFRSEMEAIDWMVGGVLENDHRKFVLLLSGLSSLSNISRHPPEYGARHAV